MSEKFFVTFLEICFEKLCQPHLSSDLLEIQFQGSQRHGIMVFVFDFANFTWGGGSRVPKSEIFSVIFGHVYCLLDAYEICFYVIQQHGLNPFQTILQYFTLQGGGQKSEKFFVTFFEICFCQAVQTTSLICFI